MAPISFETGWTQPKSRHSRLRRSPIIALPVTAAWRAEAGGRAVRSRLLPKVNFVWPSYFIGIRGRRMHDDHDLAAVRPRATLIVAFPAESDHPRATCSLRHTTSCALAIRTPEQRGHAVSSHTRARIKPDVTSAHTLPALRRCRSSAYHAAGLYRRRTWPRGRTEISSRICWGLVYPESAGNLEPDEYGKYRVCPSAPCN